MLVMQAAIAANTAEGLRVYDNKPSYPPPLPLTKPKPIQLHTFKIKGVEIKARNKKDAIKRFNHLKKK